MEFEDHYQTLGVSPDAAALEIRKAYRQLVLELHPDRNPGNVVAEERFKKVGAAYQVLSNSLRRAEYDQVYRLNNPLPKPTYTAPPAPPPRSAPPKPSREDLAQRRRARARAAEEARVYTQYDGEANDFEGRDVLNGIVAGTYIAFLFGELVIKKETANSGMTLLIWSFAPLLGAPIGYRIGGVIEAMLERSVEKVGDVIPLLEAGAKLFPVIGATFGAFGALWLAQFFGVELSTVGILPAALAAGIASAVGSAFGRAFTSVSTSFIGKFFGLGVAATVGLVAGALIGAGLAVSRFGSTGGLPMADVVMCAVTGGACGAAAASALGAWMGSGTAQVIDLREERRRKSS